MAAALFPEISDAGLHVPIHDDDAVVAHLPAHASIGLGDEFELDARAVGDVFTADALFAAAGIDFHLQWEARIRVPTAKLRHIAGGDDRPSMAADATEVEVVRRCFGLRRCTTGPVTRSSCTKSSGLGIREKTVNRERTALDKKTIIIGARTKRLEQRPNAGDLVR